MTQPMYTKGLFQIVGSLTVYTIMWLAPIHGELSIHLFLTFPLLTAGREKRPIKSLVVGRPILLALEDIDGSPSFLEKALRFLEKHGRAKQC